VIKVYRHRKKVRSFYVFIAIIQLSWIMNIGLLTGYIFNFLLHRQYFQQHDIALLCWKCH